ncbi:hypothetical protein BFJ70_g16605 [Fusarium oxysporum]|nr:hypothetical protein BFJ70_g16605 [Fusarium oxysporum]
MSTHQSLTSTLDSLVTELLELSSSLNSLRLRGDESTQALREKQKREVRKRKPTQKPEMGSQLSKEVDNPCKTPTELQSLTTVLSGMEPISDRLHALTLQAKEAWAQAQNLTVPNNQKVMDNTPNRPQMDSRSETLCKRQIDIQLGISEQEAASDSQSIETSSSQPAQTSDHQQPAESDDATMTGNDLAATSSPPDSPKDGGDDINVHRAIYIPATPSPAKQSARAGLNTYLECGSFARSHSAVTESSAASTAADMSPAGSVATTHITWPESSAGACEQDEIMLDVGTGDGAQTGESFAGGLNAETDQSPTADTRADQPPRSAAGNDEADDEAIHAADSTTSPPPPVASDVSPPCNEHADGQQARSPFASSGREESDATSKEAEPNTRPRTPTIQWSSPSQASEAATQITSPDSSTGICGQDITMSGVESTDEGQSRYCPAGDLNAAPAETDIIQPPQSPAANETTNMADYVIDIEANSAPRTLQGHTTNNEANSPGSRQSPAAEGTDVQGDADQRDTGPRSRLPTLSLADMARLTSKIQELEAQGCAQHISVPHVKVELDDVKKCIDTGDWRCTTCEYKVDRKGEGYVSIYAGMPKDQPLIDWPAFGAEFKRPTTDEAKAVFENTVQNPPEGKIPYYIGHADILSEQPLDPGPLITGNPDFVDIHTNYHHIGGHRSGNRIHWEDFTHLDETDEGPVWSGLRSFNEVYFGTGYKLWLMIAKHHIAKFDAFVRKTWQCKECIGGISHRCLFLAPSSLEKPGIDFNIYVVGRGEAVWTLPGQQHSIINVGHCAARSMNFLYPGETIDYKKLAHCLECDQHPISIKHGVPLVSTELGQKRKQHQAHSDFPLKKTRNNTAPVRELAKTEESLASFKYRPPQIDRQNVTIAETSVYKLVAAVRSTSALRQFTELVKEWRQQHTTISVNQSQGMLEQAMVQLKCCVVKSRLCKLRLRLAQRRIAKEAEKAKNPIQLQHTSTFLDELAKRHNLRKDELKSHLKEGKQWDSVCGRHDGLLPFILLDKHNEFAISKGKWISLTHQDNVKDMKAFHDLLDDDYVKNICAAGKLIEEMVFGAPIAFAWERTRLNFASDNVDVAIGELA